MTLFRVPALDELELQVLLEIDRLNERLNYLVGDAPKRWQGLLRRSTFARAIQGSNSIEGYQVSDEDAMAAFDGVEPQDATAETWAAIVGYRRAMTYVMQLSNDPHYRFSPDLIKSLHFMMMEHDLAKNPGKWRPGIVYVRNEATGRIVYEGPPADRVPGLIDALVEAQSTARDHPRVTAAMCHLNFVMIHPFSDGNGRMARCLQTLLLSRTGVKHPVFSSIEEYLGRNTPDYYQVLAAIGDGAWRPERDTRPWIRFCLTAHFRQATTLLRRSSEYQKLWDRLEDTVKRLGLPERVILALNDAAMGYRIRNPSYRKNAEVSEQVAGRDLKLAVDSGLLIAEGERRGRYYRAAPILREIREQTRERATIPDPFEEGSKAQISLPLPQE